MSVKHFFAEINGKTYTSGGVISFIRRKKSHESAVNIYSVYWPFPIKKGKELVKVYFLKLIDSRVQFEGECIDFKYEC